MKKHWEISIPCLLMVMLMAGCGDSSPPVNQTSSTPSADETTAEVDEESLQNALPDSEPVITEDSTAGGGSRFKPLTMDSVSTPGGGNQDSKISAGLSDEERIQKVMAQLRPLQILLGEWRGTTRREYEGFKAVDNHEWIWDLQSNPTSPALVLQSDKSPYLKSARLTWNPDNDQFLLTATDSDGTSRDYSWRLH